MKESSKRVWTVRLLALLVMSFGFSFLVSIDPGNKRIFKKRIEIRVNKNVGEIVATVEKLGRDDIHIKTKDESFWFVRKPRLLWGGAGLFVGLGMLLGIYHAIYCIINCIISSLLNRKERDDNLLKPI